jgi:hypothetical protein
MTQLGGPMSGDPVTSLMQTSKYTIYHIPLESFQYITEKSLARENAYLCTVQLYSLLLGSNTLYFNTLYKGSPKQFEYLSLLASSYAK